MKITRKSLLFTVVTLSVLILFPPLLLSQTRLTVAPVKGAKTARLLPDLIVSNIKLIKDCKIEITIKNIGTSGVPASGYDLKKGAGIQMYNGGKAWGGIRLGAIDRSGRLKTPGSSVKYVWFPKAANLALGAGTHSIKVVVDNNNAVAELNENNNSKTSRLICEQPARKKEKKKMQKEVSKRTDGVSQHKKKLEPRQPSKPGRIARPMPDLIVSNVRLVKDCKIEITIKNIGTSGVPVSGYHLKKGAGIQMYNGGKAWGGIRLGAIDRSGRLKTPGSSVKYVWFPKAANLALGAGTHSIKVVVDNNNAVAELNENNNSKTSRLMCKQPVSKKEKRKMQKEVSKRTDGVSQLQTKLDLPRSPFGTPKPHIGTSPPDQNQPRHGGVFGQLDDPSPVAQPAVRADIPGLSLSEGIPEPTPTEPADLALEMSISPQNAVVGEDTINVTLQVTNIGGRATSANTILTLAFSDSPYVNHFLNLDQWTIPRLGPGGEHTVTYQQVIPEHYTAPGGSVSYTVESGAYLFRAGIDTSTLASDETTNYSNDTAELIFQLTLSPKPDLVVCFSKNVVSMVGSMVRYQAVVKNIGNAPSGPMNMRFYIHSWGERNYAVPGLPVDGTYSDIWFNIGQLRPWKAGEHGFNLWVDNNHDVIESNDANNRIKGTLHVMRRLVANATVFTTSPVQCSNEPDMAD